MMSCYLGSYKFIKRWSEVLVIYYVLALGF